MKKGWKIALISLGSLLGIVVVAVAVALWLVFTPSQLTKIVNKLAANYVNCETHFESVDLTLFKTFPDAGLKVGRVYIVNPMDGAPSDTVASIGSLTVGVDVKKFLKENEVIVHQVLLDDVKADLYINRQGQSNFDIFPKSEDEDTTGSDFSLDSLPNMDLRKIKISSLDAHLLDEHDGIMANIDDLGLKVVGTLKEGRVDADIDLDGNMIQLAMFDSAAATLGARLDDLSLNLKGKGNLDAVDGKLKLCVKKGTLNTGGTEMVNETLQASKNDLLTLSLPFNADLRRMAVTLGDSRLQLDDYALNLSGDVLLDPVSVDVAVATDGDWQVEPLLALLPEQYVDWKKGMDLDAKVNLQATAKGTLSDSTFPLIDATAQLADGRFHYPQALPYKVDKIMADLGARLDLGKGGVSSAKINSIKAHTRNTQVSLTGTVGDLLGDMNIHANLDARLPLADAMPMVPDSLNLKADGKADIRAVLDGRLSQLEKLALDKIKADVSLKLADLDFTLDSLRASAPDLDVKLQLPSKQAKPSVGDISLSGSEINVQTGGIRARLASPDIKASVNNVLSEQVAAIFDVRVGETEANLDSTMVSLEALQLKGSARLDSTQQNILRQYNPDIDLETHGAVLYMPQLPDAVRLSQLAVSYAPKGAEIRTAEVKLGHSDFQLYGTVDNLEQWLDHKGMLVADLNFTSGYADVDQLLDLVSGIGTDADTIEQMRQEDNVPSEAKPFIVPKDVDVTLHTHIQRSIAFGNDLNDVAGAVTVKDGVAVLDQIGFVCKAATMQLTALYRSPRPNNLFVALDFHLLDIQIDELIDMIPTIDTLVPLLASFNGKANFHLAAETFLNARYEPKMSSLLGSAAISGRDLAVLDNNSIATIAKLMQFKSWKDKDNKIRIDSLDVELTCFRKEIEVFPFLLNIGKYQLCASGKQMLDGQCGYHVELLKNPFLAKVGVDVKGNIASPKITLGEVRYADLYRPDRQGVVEKQTLELKRQIKAALEANVR